MPPKNYEASVLFKLNYASSAHVVINQGGTSSGKTYAIQQVLFCLACQKGEQVITVVGQDIPNLKAGVLRDALTIYNKSSQLKKLVNKFNKTDRIFEFYNGSIKKRHKRFAYPAKYRLQDHRDQTKTIGGKCSGATTRSR
jgi:phage terminase large subunit